MRLALIATTAALALLSAAPAEAGIFYFDDAQFPLAIPDQGEAIATVTIGPAYGTFIGPDEDISVRFTIVHPRLGDLRIFLVSPEGLALTLLRESDNLNFHRMIGTTFTDAAQEKMTAESFVSDPNGFHPFHASYLPDGSLVGRASITSFAGFRGSELNGTWSLVVDDLRRNNLGSIFSASGELDGDDPSEFRTALITTPHVSSAVPEPSSLALCGVAGLAGIGIARARRRAA